ncbi:MAG: 2,3-bisphosphoglycerate-independent phosphoglycerate mutase [Bacillota bacterium]|nr:2,3-bisphosphoglycerate-independent phosphoglycerate mutase [Bacillota bacterium]
MKYILVIGDGMADNPVPELNGKTPLGAANKPHIDELAKKSEVGTVRTIPIGVPAGSDTGILSIFGYDPRKYYTGRSPLEAAGSGVELKAGDISYRCNMVALSDDDVPLAEKVIYSHSGGSIEGDQSIALMKYLLEDARFSAASKKYGMSFHLNPSFRHIAVQSGGDISGLIATPPHDILKQKIGQYLPKGTGSEPLVELMTIANEVLANAPINDERRKSGHLPANGIWFWAEGTVASLPSFKEKYSGKTCAAITAVPLVSGIAALAGGDSIEVEGATGEIDTNYEGKVDATISALDKGYDFVCLHVEAPDECTHNGDLKGKIKAIEYIDSRVIANLVPKLEKRGEDFRILIISDHKTLMSTRTHDGEPVPFLIYDSRNKVGSGNSYTEENGLKGPFVEDGFTILARLMELNKQ